MGRRKYHSFGEIEDAIKSKMKTAISTVEEMAYKDALLHTADFYNSPQPNTYVRTYRLRVSPDSTGVIEIGNGYQATIYRDTNYSYVEGDAEEIHNWAEEHTHGILGKGHTWADTINDIDRDFNNVFNRYFK